MCDYNCAMLVNENIINPPLSLTHTHIHTHTHTHTHTMRASDPPLSSHSSAMSETAARFLLKKRAKSNPQQQRSPEKARVRKTEGSSDGPRFVLVRPVPYAPDCTCEDGGRISRTGHSHTRINSHSHTATATLPPHQQAQPLTAPVPTLHPRTMAAHRHARRRSR